MKKEKCAWFIKIKGNFGNSGLCMFGDCRINLDDCKKCENYTGVKNKRSRINES